MKEWAKDFYYSKSWRKCREAYKKTQHGICERCQGIAEVVHHKIYLTPSNINDPTITLDYANLEALCLDCHNKEHHSGDALDLGYSYDEDGNIVYAPHFRGGVDVSSTEPPP